MAGRRTGITTGKAIGGSKRWTLVLLSATQLVVSLDLAIANLMLPAIQTDLGIDRSDLQWIVSAYAMALGGFVLLGGRAADLIGRRRMLMAGLGTFGLGSVGAALAWDAPSLIGARGVQGLGAALATPAALALLASTFDEGRERNVALGVWGATGGLGGVAGVLLGGILAGSIGWEWAFALNLPVVAAVLALAPVVLPESRSDRDRRLDVPGAVLVTTGLSSAVVTIARVGSAGWDSAGTLAAGGLSLVSLAAFVAVELRAGDPLVSFSVLRARIVQGANLSAMLVTATVAPMFLLLTLYVQQVLGYSPLRAGLAYLAIAGTTTLWSAVASRFVSRVGPRPVLASGLGLLAVGLAWFGRVPAEGSYAVDLLPGFLVVAAGMAFSFVGVNTAALRGLAQRDAGLGYGLMGTSQQIGAALGVAVLSSIAVVHADAGLRAGDDASLALTSGLQAGFRAGMLVALAGAVVALTLLRDERPTPQGSAVPGEVPGLATSA